MKKIWFVVAIAALLLLWWAVDRKNSVPSISVIAVTTENIASTISTNGKVEPVEFAAARAEISGAVRRTFVERGQEVSKGQVLVTLDDSTERAAVDSARAALEQAKANQSVVSEGGRAADTAEIDNNLKTARLVLAEAQRNLDSLQRLQAQQAATKQEVLNAQDVVARAKVQIETLEARRQTLVTAPDRSISGAKLQDAQAALTLAEQRLGLTVIRSPIAGTAYQFDIKVGAFLNPGDLVAMVGQLSKVRVRVYVDEPELGRVANGLPVDITWDARPGQTWHGTVARLPTEIVALNTRQVGIVTCVIENPKHELLPGTNIDAKIVSRVVDGALAIPKQALEENSKGNGVFKIVDDKALWIPVTTGVSDVSNVEITSGLKVGDLVALPSDAVLRDGMTVKVLDD